MNNNINTLINSLAKIGEIRKAVKNNGEYSSTSDNTMAVGTRRKIYKYFPKNKQELQEIIAEKIYNEGNVNYECDLNDIDIRGAGDNLSALFYLSNNKNMCTFWTKQKYNYNINIRKFKGYIEEWDVSNVKNMGYMFYGCEAFDQDLSRWDVSNVRDMYGMFCGCSNFNQSLSEWDVHNVEDMSYMFEGCENFDQDISGWDISKVVSWTYIFKDCPIKEKHKPNFDYSNIL